MDHAIAKLQTTPCSSKDSSRVDQEIAALILQKTQFQKSKLSTQTNIVWPSNSKNGELRTREAVQEVYSKLSTGLKCNQDVRKGINGVSELYNYPGFDYINSIPTEYMHSICIGLVKRLLELTFNVGKNRYRITTRKLSPPAKYNYEMKSQKVPREFSRRSRNLDFGVLKAQEMRNILIFFSQLS